MSKLNNKVQLIGNLGQDPVIKNNENSKVANFSIAVDESYKNQKGEKVEKTVWFPIEAWGAMANLAEKHLKKGDNITVSGKLVISTFEKDGIKKTHTSIRMDEVNFNSLKERKVDEE